MMTILRSLALLLLASLAIADDEVVLPGEFLYCETCHGVQLMGNPVLTAPRLSGMPAWYVEQQLRGFRAGWRAGHDGDDAGLEMAPMAKALTNEQIGEVAGYVARTRSPAPERTLDGEPDDGAFFYTTCSSCHGVNGEGNRDMGSPPLVGLNDWYLLEQLRKFRGGLRGTHPDDTFGLQMKAATDILPDDRAIADVVAYIMTLNNDNNPGDQ